MWTDSRKAWTDKYHFLIYMNVFPLFDAHFFGAAQQLNTLNVRESVQLTSK